MGRQVSPDNYPFARSTWLGSHCKSWHSRGTFIDLYLGEVITTKEATKRFISVSQDSKSDIGSYLFDLDFNYDSGTECEFTLDAYRYGNVSHFFNHSCSPNLKGGIPLFYWSFRHASPHSIAFLLADQSQRRSAYFWLHGTGRNHNRVPAAMLAKRSRKGASVDSDDDDFAAMPSHRNIEIDFDDMTPDSRRSSSGAMKRNQNKPIKCLCGSANCRKFIYI